MTPPDNTPPEDPVYAGAAEPMEPGRAPRSFRDIDIIDETRGSNIHMSDAAAKGLRKAISEALSVFTDDYTTERGSGSTVAFVTVQRDGAAQPAFIIHSVAYRTVSRDTERLRSCTGYMITAVRYVNDTTCVPAHLEEHPIGIVSGRNDAAMVIAEHILAPMLRGDLDDSLPF